MQQQYPKENENVGVTVLSLRDELAKRTQSRLLLLALCGAAICLLVIACANLANLLLVRSLARQKELSIRISLGANRRSILRQLLSESLILGVAGGVGAIGVAAGRVAATFTTGADWPSHAGSSTGRSAPAVLCPDPDGDHLYRIRGRSGDSDLPKCRLQWLREGVRTGGTGSHRLRSALVIAEVAVSVVLLISSGLLIRAMWKVQATDPGFRTENVLTLRTALPIPKYENVKPREQFYTKVLTDVRRLPGVTDAAYISALPMVWRGGIWPVVMNGQSQDPSRRQHREPALRDARVLRDHGDSSEGRTRRERV